MGHCKHNDLQKDDFLPELEDKDIALKFIHAVQHPDLFADEKDLSSKQGVDLYHWVETMGQKAWKKDQEAKENADISEITDK